MSRAWLLAVLAGCAVKLVKHEAPKACAEPTELIEDSAKALNDGNLLVAEARANDAVAACPTSAKAHLTLARAQAELGLADEAKRSATRAADRGADPAAVQQIDDVVDQLPRFDRVPANDAEQMAADYLLESGRTARNAGHFTEALQKLRKAFTYRADVGTILEIARTEEMAASGDDPDPDAELEARKTYARAMRFAEKTRGQTAVPQPATTVTDATLAALSADGSLLASGAGDDVKIEDLRSSGELALIHLDARVTALGFEPGGRLVVADEKGVVKLYDTNTKGQPRATAAGAGAAIHHLAFDRDGKYVATGDEVGRVVVRDLADPNLKEVASYADHVGQVTAVALSAAGDWVASGGADCAIELARVDNIKWRRTLARHTAEIDGVAFRYDGKLLASADINGEVYLWETETGDLRRALDTKDHRNILVLAFRPGGEELRAMSGSGDLLTWSTTDWKMTEGQIIRSAPVRQQQTDDAEDTFSDDPAAAYDTIAPSADGSRVALLSYGILSVADLAGTGQTTMAAGLPMVSQLRFAGGQLISLGAGDDGNIIAWPLEGGAPHQIASHTPSIAVSPKGDELILLGTATDSNNKARPELDRISPATGENAGDPIPVDQAGELGPRGGLITLIAEDKDTGSKADKKSERAEPRGYGKQAPREKEEKAKENKHEAKIGYRSLDGHTVEHGGVMAALNADESRLAVIVPGESDGYDLEVYDQADEPAGSRPHVSTDRPDRVAIDPAGKYAAVTADKTVSVFELEQPTALPATLSVEGGLESALALGPDGQVVIIDGKDRKLIIAKVVGGKLVAPPPLLHHVTTVELSPDGKLVAAGGEDGTITLVATADGHVVATLLGNEQRWVVFAGDHVDGSSGEDDTTATRGADLLVWRVGDLQLPGQSAWDRQLKDGLLGDVMRPYGINAKPAAAAPPPTPRRVRSYTD
jgi:WD40 repeat protein